MDLLTTVGKCDNGFACVYQNNLSWSSPTTPLPAEAHPRAVFERLFGEGGSAADRRGAAQERQHPRLGDERHPSVARDAGTLRSHKGQRIPRTLCAKWSGAFRRPRSKRRIRVYPISIVRRRTGIVWRPCATDVRLQVLALQGDVTRVITFQLARETSTRTYTGSRASRTRTTRLRITRTIPQNSKRWRKSTLTMCRCSRTSWAS